MRKQDLLARTGGNLQGAVSWAFTFSEQPWFNGLRALTTNEVALPVFNTFKLFARLAPKRLAVDAPAMIPVDAIIADSVRGEPDLGVVASIDDARSRLTILAVELPRCRRRLRGPSRHARHARRSAARQPPRARRRTQHR